MSRNHNTLQSYVVIDSVKEMFESMKSDSAILRGNINCFERELNELTKPRDALFVEINKSQLCGAELNAAKNKLAELNDAMTLKEKDLKMHQRMSEEINAAIVNIATTAAVLDRDRKSSLAASQHTLCPAPLTQAQPAAASSAHEINAEERKSATPT